MVAISLYRGDLHKASDVPRQWLMPTPQISFKNFKLLLRRRSLALSRLSPTPASTFNLDPTPRPQDGARVSQETTTVNSSVVVDPTVPSAPDSSVTMLETPPLCTNTNSLAIEKSVMVDVVNEIEKTKRDVEIKLKSLNTRKHNLVKLLKQVLNAVDESKRRNPVVPIRTDTVNGPPVYIPTQPIPGSGDANRGDVVQTYQSRSRPHPNQTVSVPTATPTTGGTHLKEKNGIQSPRL